MNGNERDDQWSVGTKIGIFLWCCGRVREGVDTRRFLVLRACRRAFDSVEKVGLFVTLAVLFVGARSSLGIMFRHMMRQRGSDVVNRGGYKLWRCFSSSTEDKTGEMIARLKEKLDATNVDVEDISGGCGSMYRVEVESPKFKGVSLVKQHRMVNEVLKGDISEMHGLTINTRASS